MIRPIRPRLVHPKTGEKKKGTYIFGSENVYGQYGKKTSPTLDQLNKVWSVDTLPKTNTAPKNAPSPGVNFRGRTVSFKEGSHEKFKILHLRWVWSSLPKSPPTHHFCHHIGMIASFSIQDPGNKTTAPWTFIFYMVTGGKHPKSSPPKHRWLPPWDWDW